MRNHSRLTRLEKAVKPAIDTAWLTVDEWLASYDAQCAGATFEESLPATVTPTSARAHAIDFHYTVALPRERQAAEATALIDEFDYES